MKRVTGIGGVFFTCDDPKKQKEWYATHLGIPNGGVFEWRDKENPDHVCSSVLGLFKKDTDYLKPGTKDHMLNFRVDNLVELIEQLKQEDVEVVGDIQDHDYGKFGWIMDPEGNKIELWEPKGE
jgi:predicted enzyme related to lactoylglutathione lyase